MLERILLKSAEVLGIAVVSVGVIAVVGLVILVIAIYSSTDNPFR